MSLAPEIKGWCPGALRPMASGDGLLLRAKTIGSALPASAAAEIAAIAADCGNGLLDLSQRAQLQLRGVTAATLAATQARLARIGLLASDAATEGISNVVASPLAGLDSEAAFDANELAQDIVRAVGDDPTLRALPGKFLFLVDDGSALGLAAVDADIRLTSASPGKVAVQLDGAREWAILVEPCDAVETALRLARAFVRLRGNAFEKRRMRSLVAACGAQTVFDVAAVAAQRAVPAPTPTSINAVYGAHCARGQHYAGVGAPLGRWRAEDLSWLADAAMQLGQGELRLTPWRAIVAPTPSLDAADGIVSEAKRRGLIAGGDDPRLAIVACPGAPECSQGRGETRRDLDRLAPFAKRILAEGPALHISGCAKGCAHPGEAPVTLVATQSGFDVVFNGKAHGAPVLEAQTIEQIVKILSSHAQEAQ
jgi:precorrin-3B synthase